MAQSAPLRARREPALREIATARAARSPSRSSSSAHPGPAHNKDGRVSLSSITHHLTASIVPSFRQVSYRGAHVHMTSPSPSPKQCNPGHVQIQTLKASNSQNNNGDADIEHVSHVATTKIPAPIIMLTLRRIATIIDTWEVDIPDPPAKKNLKNS